MSLSFSHKELILRAYDASRTRLPDVADVQARPNVRRLASISVRSGRRAILNLSTAVVEAGQDAWDLIAPALEGHQGSRRRLRELSHAGIEANRARRQPNGRNKKSRRAGSPRSLPRTRCDGSPQQRRFLLDLIAFVRETSGHATAIPSDIQVRISRRMSSALGTCTSTGASHRITISERLFRAGLEDVLWDTVKHELAHLANRVTRQGKREDEGHAPHGLQWRAWARRLGAVPERRCGPRDAKRILAAQRRGRDGPLTYPEEVSLWVGPVALFPGPGDG